MITTITNKAGPYALNGIQDTFIFTFPISGEADIHVFVKSDVTTLQTELAYSTDYAVEAVNNDFSNGGSVVLTGDALAEHDSGVLVVLRTTEQTQETDAEGMATEDVETGLDKLQKQVHELQEQLNRVLLHQETDTPDMVLPDRAARKGMFFTWDAEGAPFATPGVLLGSVPVSAFGKTLIDDTTAGAALTTLGALGIAEQAADSDKLNGVAGITLAESIKAGFNITGGGTVTLNGSYYLKWSARFIVISGGRGTHFSTNGYFDIGPNPTSGAVTVVGGAAARNWTADGVLLDTWEALYYILPIGSSSGSRSANFRVAYYTSNLEVPYNWILLALRNHDGPATVKLCTGAYLRAGETWEEAYKVWHSGNDGTGSGLDADTVDGFHVSNIGWVKITNPGTGWLGSKTSGWTADQFTPGGLEIDFSAVVPAGTRAVRCIVISGSNAGHVYWRKCGDTNISNTPNASAERSHTLFYLAAARQQAILWLSDDYKVEFAVSVNTVDLYIAYPMGYLL